MPGDAVVVRVLVIGAGWVGDILNSVAAACMACGCPTAIVADDGGPVPAGFTARMRRRLGSKVRPDPAARAAAVAAAAARAVADAVPHLVIIVGEAAVTPELLDRLRRAGVRRVVAWLIDDPFVCWSEPPRVRAWGMAMYPLCDRLFVFDGHYLDALRRHFAVPADELLLAADSGIFQPLTLAKEYPVSFIGTGYPDREEMLAHVPAEQLFLWGMDWRKLAARQRGGVVPPAAANRIYAASRVVLNMNHPQTLTTTNTRTFEVLAGNNFLLTDWRPGLDRLLAPDREVVSYRDAGELREKTAYYLAHPEAAAAIAAAGGERVRREHTFVQRVRAILAQAGV